MMTYYIESSGCYENEWHEKIETTECDWCQDVAPANDWFEEVENNKHMCYECQRNQQFIENNLTKPKTTNMKTTVKKTTEVEVDIQLPYYFKNKCHAFAIFNETSAMCISYALSNHESISNYSWMVESVLSRVIEDDSIEISEIEFEDIYEMVRSKHKSLFLQI